MNHATEYLETMEKLAPLLRRHRYYRLWKFEMLCDWAAYYWNRGTISFVLDEEGKACGVCLIKLFRSLEQFLEPFVHEPCGRFCMVEVLVGTGPSVHRRLLDELVGRWGSQEIVIWDRAERTEGGAPRMYRWQDFERLNRIFAKHENVY